LFTLLEGKSVLLHFYQSITPHCDVNWSANHFNAAPFIPFCDFEFIAEMVNRSRPFSRLGNSDADIFFKPHHEKMGFTSSNPSFLFLAHFFLAILFLNRFLLLRKVKAQRKGNQRGVISLVHILNFWVIFRTEALREMEQEEEEENKQAATWTSYV
jgi:hypothetical protein